MTSFIKCANCGNETHWRDLEEAKSLLLQPIPPVDLFEKTAADSEALKLYPLGIYECSACSLIQIIESPPVSLFYDNYIYTSTSSPDMKANFISLKEAILQEVRLEKAQLKLLDIGCNDGLLLSMFDSHKQFSLYGTDPSPVAKNASEVSFSLHSEYFPGAATKAAAPYDVIIGTNSLAHIPKIGECFEAIAQILADDGILVIEVSDFDQMVSKGAWDYIYHEHLYYYTKRSLASILAERGLEAYRIDEITTKGGSLRVFAKHSNKKCTNPPRPFSCLNQPILQLRKKYQESLELYSVLEKEIHPHATLYGYGACATGSVAMSQHSLFRRLHSLIDDNTIRQSLFAPYWATQVVPLSHVKFASHDVVIVFAWRFIDSITRNIKSHCESNNLPLPTIVPSITKSSAAK